MKATRLAVAALAAALAVAGCGDDDEDETGAATGTATTEEQAGTATSTTGKSGSGAKGQVVRLSATDFRFTPADPSVEKAGTVTFRVVNDGQAVHALEVEGPAGEAETDAIQPGDSAALEVDLSEAGSYEMYCPIGNHEQMGMKGTVSVAGGGGGRAEDSPGGDDDGDRGPDY
jgi:uncharacterized cupredoxin-like copper-binding protein